MARNITDDPHAREIQAAIVELEGQYAGKRFSKEAKARWNELNSQLDELDVRNERIRELHDAGAVESTTDSFQPRRAQSAVERDSALWLDPRAPLV